MILKMIAAIYVESDEDPEFVASEFNRGLRRAVEGFPHGDVLYADVDSITPASDDEIGEHGLNEEE